MLACEVETSCSQLPDFQPRSSRAPLPCVPLPPGHVPRGAGVTVCPRGRRSVLSHTCRLLVSFGSVQLPRAPDRHVRGTLPCSSSPPSYCPGRAHRDLTARSGPSPYLSPCLWSRFSAARPDPCSEGTRPDCSGPQWPPLLPVLWHPGLLRPPGLCPRSSGHHPGPSCVVRSPCLLLAWL